MTTALECLIPCPRLIEIDRVDLAAPPASVWAAVRHGDLARSRLIRALFAARAVPSRLAGHAPEGDGAILIDRLVSSPDAPGFQLLVDDPPYELAVGAIGEVWRPEIRFRHVDGVAGFAAFDEPGWIKVAWALRVLPRGERNTRLEIELRVDATDDQAWRRFRRYFRIIGPASHFIRRSLLAALARDLGVADASEDEQPLPGDELLPDAEAQLTHGIDISAEPEAIWPLLVEMRRLTVGQVVPATPDGDDGFEVLRIDAPRLLVLGGLYDPDAGRQLPFDDRRPARYWHATWTLALEPLGGGITRLRVRARAAFSARQRLHAAWIRPVHHLMQTTQLENLAARAEGRQPRDDWRDLLEGLGGAARIALALLMPFGRRGRRRWGVSDAELARPYPGDERVPAPRWMWTHAVDIDAPAEEVWPWVAQIGAERAGFYSYQWLENLAGCQLRNAEVIHPEWQVRAGDEVALHPRIPPFEVVDVEPGRWFVAHAAPHAAGPDGRWITATWLFLVEPVSADRCRFFSRYRVDCSSDLVTRLEGGPALVEPVGFAMDRRMLLGVKERAERARIRSLGGQRALDGLDVRRLGHPGVEEMPSAGRFEALLR